MFGKIKQLGKFKFPGKDDVQDKIAAIQEELSSGLFEIMDKAYAERQQDTSNSNFTIDDTQRIIDQYANKNMMIAAATSIVPGPMGILGSIPELLLNFNNQMNMIYDLGCASGKESFLNKDVLLDIPMAAFGGNTDLSALQGKTNLLDSPQTMLLDKATSLGKNMVEKTLKKSIVQFIPVAGPVLMGAWSKMATRKISKVSLNFLDDQKTYTESVTPEETETTKRLLQIEKIKALANLIESNNEINEDQIQLIGTIIENSYLTDQEKEYYLTESLKTGSKFTLDKSLINKYEEADDLIMEMAVMAKRGDGIDRYESAYIHEVGQYLGIEEDFIKELL